MDITDINVLATALDIYGKNIQMVILSGKMGSLQHQLSEALRYTLIEPKEPPNWDILPGLIADLEVSIKMMVMALELPDGVYQKIYRAKMDDLTQLLKDSHLLDIKDDENDVTDHDQQ